MAQHLDADSPEDDNDMHPHTPPYRAPIAYEQKNWSLAEARWGDTECLEYLWFSKAEISELIMHLGLAEWVDSAVAMPDEYTRHAETLSPSITSTA